MKLFGITVLCCLAIACLVLPAGAATVSSSFNAFVYSYNVTPAPGEVIKDFHVYVALNECAISAYLTWVMPPNWNFTTVPLATKCALSWWTTGAALPVGQAALFAYTHYCAPCCHSWIVTGTGSENPEVPPVSPLDGSWNHLTEPCNIPPAYSDYCHGGGLVLAPRYPTMTPVENSTWGQIKVLYQ